jgi:hypothetical protein
MPFGAIGTPAAILLVTLVVPVAFRYVWPGGIARPSLFLVVTLTLALIVAAFAIFWYFQALLGVGFSTPSSATANGSALFETQLRNRFFTAAICAVLAQYWLCRATQFFLGRH